MVQEWAPATCEGCEYAGRSFRTFDRILDGPTSERFIDPWVRHLTSLGVRSVTGHLVESLELGPDGRITAARARTAAGPAHIDSDWFVAALRVDRVRRL
ncbi:hypothetical protein [Streptomyces sp. NPDC058297]|uniref:hypothetical protein n=1 Tax=Streptomyces sp. NPDC058297 TaxID=3346433 RepID=UPI0036E8BC1D